MHLNFFKHIHSLEIRIAKLEQKLVEQNTEAQRQLDITRSQLILSKQGAPILDWAILNGYSYTDLSPAAAMEYYNNPNVIYKVLDVTKHNYRPEFKFDNILKVSLDNIESAIDDIRQSKGILFVISEEGLNSIKACEKLAKLGVYNCFNISGGYEYLPSVSNLKKAA